MMCLSLTGLFFATQLNTLTPFQANEVQKLNINDSKIELFEDENFNKIRNLNKTINPRLLKLDYDFAIKEKENREKLKLEEEEQLKEIEKQKKQNKRQEGIPIRLLVTYYGDTASQCGNNLGIMANGEKVHYGAIAVPNSIKLGSKIRMDKSGREFTAKDRGNPKYICELGENYYRVDIFIPRNEGESTSAYESRVRDMGTDDVTARLYLE